MTESYKFENILNFRDVGSHINSIVGSQVLKSGLFFRSARPDEATSSDRHQLVDKYKVKTIIDLRSRTEHINAAKKRANVPLADQSAALPSSDTSSFQPTQISGIQYANINLNGKGFERHLIWQLKYLSLAKLILLMALGYRVQGIAILGRELMLPRGLVGLGKDTIDHSGPEIKQVFDVLANEQSWPILINCTQGKDRTGITVLLVLLLCGIDLDSITKDYVRSEPELEPEKAARMEEIASIGLDESFAGCPDDFCSKICQHLESRYGGIEKYLETIGVAESQYRAVKDILLVKR